MNFSYNVLLKDREVQRFRSHSLRRFYRNLRTINWHTGHPKVYLRIHYDKGIGVTGRRVDFYNDGVYESERELLSALKAFIESNQ